MTFLDSFYAQGIERCLASGAWDPFAGDLPPPRFLDSALLATSCRGLTLFDIILIAVALLAIAKFVGWLLVKTLNLIARRRPSSPKPETTPTPTTDAAPTSIHDDWADIAQQVGAENANALTVAETKPMQVGESREALAAYLGIPNDNPEGDKK